MRRTLCLGMSLVLLAGCEGKFFAHFVGRQVQLVAAAQIAPESAGAVEIEVQIDLASTKDVAIPFALSGSAVRGEDFTASPSPLIVPAGATSAKITINAIDDALPEGDETIVITLTATDRVRLRGRAEFTLTLTDDDLSPVLNVSDATGAEPSGALRFDVTLSASSGLPVSVSYQTQPDSATADSDYQAASGVLTFAPGVTQQSVLVPIIDDDLIEGSEAMSLVLSSPSNAALGKDVGIGTVLDDDTIPQIAIADAAATEQSGALSFKVSLSQATARTVSVGYATTDDTATAGSDYTVTSGTLTFAPGVTVQTFSVPLLDDFDLEHSETFFADLSSPAEATITTGRAKGTILDDEVTPTVAIDDPSAGESSSAMTFTVTVSEPAGVTIAVDYATSDGTATAGSDFTAASGTLTLPPGATSGTVDVSLLDDLFDESNETLFVDLSGSSGAGIGKSRGTGTILDDEGTPTLRILDASAPEQSLSLVFDVTLSIAFGATVTVDYGTRDGTADPSDYDLRSGTVTFQPGQTLQTITVPLVDDSDLEGSETLYVDLSNNSSNSIVGRATATGTILDNETVPVIDIAGVSGVEDVTPMTFLVTLSEPTGLTVSADYLTINGSAESSLDFAFTAGTVTFTAGEVQKSLSITILDDALVEGTEDFSVDLTNLANAQAGVTTGIGTIFDDDVVPNLTIDDRTASESDPSVTFTVTLSEQTGTPVTLDWATADGSATAGSDYLADGGTLTFDPGVTLLTLTVDLVGNLVPETPETFFVNLSNVGGANPFDVQGAATITDDDTPPVVEIDPSSPTTANENDLVATKVRVFFDQSSVVEIQVPFTVTNVTAEPADYTVSPASPLVFSAGTTSIDIEITPQQDADTDDDQLTITLGTPTPLGAATLGTTISHTLTIVDDDSVPALVSAETLDADSDGKIEHYRLTFSKPMNDATFPGYSAASNVGDAQNEWLVAGRTDVVLVRDAAAPEADVANDPVIYVRFTPSAVPDSGDKPDVTTTASPGLKATDGTSLPQVTSGTVSETDKAPPVVLRVSTESGLSDLNIFFSEAVGPSGGCPGTIAATDFDYDDASGGDVAGVVDGSDNDACTDAKLVLAASAGTFTASDVFSDRIRPIASSIVDASGNAAPSTYVTLTAIIHPFVLTASSVDLTLARIEYSEPMQSGSATTLANYEIARNLADPDCTAAPTLSGVVQVTPEIYELTTSNQVQDCEYTITVTGNVRDIDENATLVDPKSATFLGRQPLKVVSARALSLRTFLITFSKDVLAGAGAGGASNLGYYAISGALGSVTAAARYDSVTTLVADRNKVMVTHALDQGGAFYSVVVSTSLRDASDAENLLPDPADRTTFQGLGGSVTRLDEGALFADPFGDGSSFSFTFSFAGKVHAGPNDSDSAVFRFDPDGQNPVTVTFNISTSEPAVRTSFANQVYSNGIDAFVGARVNGQDYLVFGAHRGTGQFSDLYFTQDTDNVLDIKYCAIQGVTLGNTLSLQTIFGYGSRLYFAFGSNSPSGRPLFAHLDLQAGGVCGVVDHDVRKPASGNKDTAHYLTRIGGSGEPNSNGATNIGIDSLIAFDPGTGVRLYVANNGGIISTPDLPLAGGITGSVWTEEIWDGGGWGGTTQPIPSIDRLRPGQKGVPVMTAWGGALFVARNRSDNNKAEVWKHTPPSTWTRVVNTASTVNGMNSNNTEASMVTVNGPYLYLGFDNETDGAEVWRTKAGVTAATFNGHNDLEKVAPSGFGPLGATDLAKNKYIISNTSVFFAGKSYLYLTVGCNSDFTDNGPCDRNPNAGQTDFAIRMFRQVD